MRASVYVRYGSPDVCQITEVPKPVPKENEILIRSHATTVTTGDWRARTLQMPVGFGILGRLVFGVSGPRQQILGTEVAGEVETVGARVTKFKAGDKVFAFAGAAMGCHAEYKCMPQDGAIAMKPASIGYSEAAALSFGGTTALDFFRRGKLQSGESVLVNGASGAVGSAAVQIAKHFGAEVTAVCSGANAEMVRALGADHVIDYTRDDFTDGSALYDVIVDTVGTVPFARRQAALAERGRLLLVLGGLPEMMRVPWVAMTSSRRVVAGPVRVRVEDMHLLADLAASGDVTPVIDRRYALADIADAHGYVATGRKRGSVVITFDHDD